jgi:hypothetical protein
VALSTIKPNHLNVIVDNPRLIMLSFLICSVTDLCFVVSIITLKFDLIETDIERFIDTALGFCNATNEILINYS